MTEHRIKSRPEPPKPRLPGETRFGIQFVVTRNGEPITDVITVENMPQGAGMANSQFGIQFLLMRDGAPITDVFKMELIRAEIADVDALSGVVPDARPVGLYRERGTPHTTGLPRGEGAGFVREKLGVPVLKVVNRALLALNKWLLARSTKRGTPMSIQFDDMEVTGEVTDFEQALRDAAEKNAKRGPYDVG